LTLFSLHYFSARRSACLWGRGVRTFLFKSRPPAGRLTQNLSFATVSFLCHGGALLTYYYSAAADMLLTKSGGRFQIDPFDIRRLSSTTEASVNYFARSRHALRRSLDVKEEIRNTCDSLLVQNVPPTTTQKDRRISPKTKR
jgi:hypothetical protein